MKKTVNKCEFVSAFDEFNRSENFSVAGREALYDWFCEFEEDMGSEVEFDPIAICCEFCEFEDLDEFHESYDADEYPDIEAIRDETLVIEIPGSEGFIIQSF